LEDILKQLNDAKKAESEKYVDQIANNVDVDMKGQEGAIANVSSFNL